MQYDPVEQLATEISGLLTQQQQYVMRGDTQGVQDCANLILSLRAEMQELEEVRQENLDALRAEDTDRGQPYGLY